MSQQSIEPQVVLTADTTQYEQSMESSTQATQGLGSAIDTLGAKLASLSKSAGKSLVKIAAADVATITAATAAYGAYEKQVARLQAQAAVLSANTATQARTFGTYERSVQSLRKTFGTTTSEAVALTLQLSKMQDYTRPLTALSNTFTKMSNATGESSTGLASSLLNLQKIMGTPQTRTKAYADQLTTLAAGANTSATALADFAAQIAPVGQLIGQSQTDITGVATAFTKAGQAGQPAALAYTKIVSDIAYATQSGSPNLAKYARLIGMTTEQFKQLSGTEQVTEIFDKLNTMGPKAITQLNRMGLDGMRTVRAITAMANASGGLGASVQEARSAYGDGSVDRGSAAAMKTMSHELQELRSQLTMTAEAFGQTFAPAITKVLQVAGSFASKFREMMDGPLGDFLKIIMAVAAPIAAFAGGLLLIAGALAKVAAAALLIKSSGATGFMSGMRGGGTIPVGGAMVPGGRPASWFQRGMYNIGAQAGGVAGGLMSGLRGGAEAGRGFFGTVGRVASATVRGGTDMIRSIYSPLTMGGYNDPAARMRIFNSPTFTGMFSNTQAMQAAQAAQLAGASRLSAVFAGLSGASRSVTGGFMRLGASMASATAQMGILGAKGAMGLGRMLKAGGPLIGMGALAAGSAMGIDSNALTFGSMGLMMGGPIGMGVGIAGGFGLDVAAQNKAQHQQQQDYEDALKSGVPSDIMATGNIAQKEWEKVQALGTPGSGWTNKLGIAGHLGIPDTYSLGQMAGQSKMGLEYLFTGNNPVKERMDLADKAEKDQQNLVNSLNSINVSRGKGELDTSDLKSPKLLEQLNQVVADITPNMEKLGITTEDIVKTWDKGDTVEGQKAWVKLLNDLSSPGRATGMWSQLRASGGAGKALLGSPDARLAIRFQENADYFFKGVDDITNTMRKHGMTWKQIAKNAEEGQNAVEDENSREYELLQAVSAQAQQSLSFRLPLMGRAQAFQQSTDMTTGLIAGTMKGPQTNENVQQRQGLQEQLYGSMAEQAQYFQQAMLQQKQFELSQRRAQEDFGTSRERMDYSYNLSRSRAQEDFALSRKQQEEDYNLSRQHALRDYNKQVDRSSDAYERSMKRAHTDFNRSRRQQDADYQHQVSLMIKQSAMEMYDIYQRVQVQRTHSAGFLLVNAQDQLKRMQQQENNLEILRRMGMTQDSIQTLGLGKAENQQQLQRMVAEMQSNPELVKQMNDAVGARMKAAGELVTDESSSEWDEFTRQHRIATNRATKEFERSVARSHKDFNIQMKQMDEDFKTSMSDQAQSYETSQERQQKAFSRSMKRGAEDYATAVSQMTEDFGKSMARAQEDMDLMAQHIGGNLKQIFTQAAQTLKGKIGEQADQALATFNGLDDSLGVAGVKIMIRMSQVFGFDYTPPKWYKAATAAQSPGLGQHHGGTPLDTTGANGTVLPGRSIGRDNLHYYNQEGEGLHLAGGEAIMVPEWVDQMGGPAAVKHMNMQARYGRHMSEGGVYRPAPTTTPHLDPDARVSMDGEPVSAITRAQLLLAEKLSGLNFVTMQGSWQPYTSYSGSSHMGPGVVDESPGDFHTQYWMRRVGFAAWGRNFPGAATAGSGAHVHGVSRIDPGARGHAQLSSFARGEDGLGGPDYGPNPDMLPGLLSHLSQFMGLEVTGGSSGGGRGSGRRSLKDILQSRYPDVEKMAAAVRLGGGLFKDGFWSDELNKRARKTIRNLKGAAEGGIFADPDIIGIGEKGPEMVLPLNDQGADFLADLMHRVSAGTEGRRNNVRGSNPMMVHTLNTYQIDRSATFTGDITVMANNPNELIHALRHRQRTAAMANPAMGGTKI